MGITRRELIGSGLAAGVALSAGALVAPEVARAQGKPGGILRVRGYDPPHFDPHQTLNFKMRTKDLAAREKLVLDIQRHVAEQQYYVYLYGLGYTTSWPNYVKGYAPNVSFDYGDRAAALRLER